MHSSALFASEHVKLSRGRKRRKPCSLGCCRVGGQVLQITLIHFFKKILLKSHLRYNFEGMNKKKLVIENSSLNIDGFWK